MLQVDGTRLKGWNKGVLFVAVTKEGNEQIFSLAVGIGPIENDEYWTWFRSRLRSSFEPSNQLLIVSDQHISIANAIRSVYPDAAYDLCFYHQQNKLTSYRNPVIKLYQKAAYAYRSGVFNNAMSQIENHCPGAFNRLTTTGPERWARCKCPVCRYSFLTSNTTNVFNSQLLDVRRLLVCSMIETLRHIMEQWFDQRRAETFARTDQLREAVVQKLAPVVERSCSYNVVAMSPLTFKVDTGARTCKVDMSGQQCDCREFQLDLVPCSHVVAAVRNAGLNLYSYIFSYYKMSTWKEIYSGSINHLPPRDEWVVAPEIQALVLLPPIIPLQAGRP